MTGTVQRLLAGQWVPWDSNGVPTPPPHQVTVPYFGFAADTDADWSGLSAAVGGMAVSRTYNTPATGIPASYATSSAKHDATRGAAISAISIRPSITDTASGALDAQIRAFVQSCPPGTWVTYWAEIDAITRFSTPASQAVPAYQRFYDVAKAANPSCFYGPCYMTFTWTTVASGYPPDQWFTNADGSFIRADFIGLDGYNEQAGTKRQTFQQVFQPAVTWIKARTAIPTAVMETNTIADPADGNWRRTYWNGVFAQAQQWEMPMVLGWQGGGVPQYTIFDPNDAGAISAIADLNTLSKAR